MNPPKIMYIEFVGNPHKDDKENYKRYCGIEEFKPFGPEAEVVKYVEYSAYEELRFALKDIIDLGCLEGSVIDRAKELVR